MKLNMYALFVTSLVFFFVRQADALPLSEGSVVYQSNDQIEEYTQEGALIQSFTIPDPVPGWGISEKARDIAVLGKELIFVYHGTFDPYISVLDVTTTTWSHHKSDDMWTVNNGSYGGIAVNDNYVFVTSMGPNYNDPVGFLRFDLSDNTFLPADTELSAIDLNLGLDGFLYVLYPGGSPSGRFISVHDPDSMEQVDIINLADIFGHTAHRAIAVNENSEVFIADWDGDVQKIDANGNLLSQTNLCAVSSCNLYDIDINSAGNVVVTSRFGDLLLMNEDLEDIMHMSPSFSGGFAAFVPHSPLNTLNTITDVGYAPNPSNFSYQPAPENSYTLSAGGLNIGGWQDSFGFIYEEVTGDTDFIARIVDIENHWAAGGIMLRQSLDAWSPFAACLLEKGEPGLFMTRQTEFTPTEQLVAPSIQEGSWLRINKTGSLITAYVSLDGENWEVVGSIPSFDNGNSYYVGLAGVTVDAEKAPTTDFVFDHVSLN